MNKDLSAKILADAKAKGYKPISGTTDIDEGNNRVAQHKWKIAVVLENGELPAWRTPYSKALSDAGYRQVVE